MKIETVNHPTTILICDCGSQAHGNISTEFNKNGMMVRVRIDCPSCFKARSYVGPSKDKLQLTSITPSSMFNEREMKRQQRFIKRMITGKGRRIRGLNDRP